jgi:hypothetical protein
MRDNYQFILPMGVSHFRSVSKTVSIPQDLGHRCDWRTCRSRRGILDTSRKFHRKILRCAGLLFRFHNILWPYVSRLKVTSHVLWQNLHASYPSRAYESVDELLMNPVNFHVDDPSRLINGRSD